MQKILQQRIAERLLRLEVVTAAEEFLLQHFKRDSGEEGSQDGCKLRIPQESFEDFGKFFRKIGTDGVKIVNVHGVDG